MKYLYVIYAKQIENIYSLISKRTEAELFRKVGFTKSSRYESIDIIKGIIELRFESIHKPYSASLSKTNIWGNSNYAGINLTGNVKLWALS